MIFNEWVIEMIFRKFPLSGLGNVTLVQCNCRALYLSWLKADLLMKSLGYMQSVQAALYCNANEVKLTIMETMFY